MRPTYFFPEFKICMALGLAFAGLLKADQQTEFDQRKAAFFNNEVLPILEQHCYGCHSHRAKKAKGGLVLDSRAGWQVGGESGPAIVPKKVNESLLIQAIRYEDYQMPPKGKLPADAIARIERWVAEGAHDPRISKASRANKKVDYEAGRQHWAFQPIRNSVAPNVSDDTWPRDDVDRFVLAALEKKNVSPVADADKYTWLRRVTFDLTGLPPSAEVIRNFVADSSATAREKVVDRLLESRAFGERWARHWLDLVGYADQVGTSNNVFAQHAWRYRDYVIESFNNDKPFDQFIREQIAGDLIAQDRAENDTVEQRAASITATGFLVLGDIEIVEADKEKLLVDIVDQQLNKVGKAFLGLTLECARCHDHKFDPVSQRDYYAMAGFFHSTSTVYKTERGVWSDIHALDLPETDAQAVERARREKAHAEKIAKWKTEREQAQARKSKLDAQLKDEKLSKEARGNLTKQRDESAGKISPLNAKIVHGEYFVPTVARAHGVRDAADSKDMRITIRGNPRALGDKVPRGFLKVVTTESPKIVSGRSGRRELADWVASDGNPLTARVTVNRIWQKLFGEGLVRSVDYFGLPGDKPSHPKLLDHLAGRFVANGWSQKRLIRSLVLSRTYGLGSAHNENANAVDPDNRLLWRMNRFRLDAESLRDAMLAVAGQLEPSMGGPAMALEYPENVANVDPKNVNPASFRLDRWRPNQEFQRSIYLPVIRHAAQAGPAMLRNVFDFAQPSQFTGKRAITAVPTQALFLMNSPIVRKHAQALADRIQREHEDAGRLEALWLVLLNRPITAMEKKETQAFLAASGEHAWTELCHALLASNEFLMRL